MKGRRGADRREKPKARPEHARRAKPPSWRPPPRPKIRPPSAPEVKFPAAAPAKPGEWLLTTRAAAEQDLLDELVLPPFGRDVALPRIAGPALVAVPALPKHNRPELTFARQGFPVAAVVPIADRDAGSRLARAIADALPAAQGRAAQARGPQPYSLDAWVPDDDRTNPQSGAAELLAANVARTLGELAPSWPRAADARAAWTDNALCAQLCVSGELAYVGVLPAREMPSLAPGGRLRVHLPKHAPSRAAAKLLEAFAWLDRAPEPGELCADLGAAPGGWTWVLLERRARVLAIDPAKLDSVIAKRHGLTHLRADAFKYEPEGFVDWLVADMAWRPLEAAALYGKWGRRGWARMLVANIKLPMKKKAEYLLRIRDILTSSGWGHLRVRQLYHDRDEVTVGAVLARPIQGAY